MSELAIDVRTLRAALRSAFMAGRLDLQDAHWARADEYAMKKLSHWNAAAEVTDWCPECQARESAPVRDPLGDPGEKTEWLSTMIHRLPCVPAISGLSPDQYQVYRLGWGHGIKEAGKLAKNYVDPRVLSARRMAVRAERVIAELIGAPAPTDFEGKTYDRT